VRLAACWAHRFVGASHGRLPWLEHAEGVSEAVLRYTLIRFGGMIGVLLAISVLTFLIMHAIPAGHSIR